MHATNAVKVVASDIQIFRSVLRLNEPVEVSFRTTPGANLTASARSDEKRNRPEGRESDDAASGASDPQSLIGSYLIVDTSTLFIAVIVDIPTSQSSGPPPLHRTTIGLEPRGVRQRTSQWDILFSFESRYIFSSLFFDTLRCSRRTRSRTTVRRPTNLCQAALLLVLARHLLPELPCHCRPA